MKTELTILQLAELVVMLSHLGFPQDVQMVRDVKGIDVCISGHTHNRLRAPEVVDGTYIIQSGSHGSFLGQMDLTLDENGISSLRHELLDVSEDVPEDEEMKALVHRTMAPYREKLDARVGETLVDLHRGTSLESPTDNLILSALLQVSGAEAAFSNGWRYGAPVPKGEVTLRDLYNIIPVNPPVSTVEITGAEMYEMIEANLESTYAKDPFDQLGGYLKRALGIRVYIKIENAKGSRIQRFFVGKEELDLEKTYTVAFVTQQGVPEKFGKNRKNMDVRAVDALKTYLATLRFDLGQVDTFIVV
jgi:S-sulfosulfanyl-L-cysteine sulfohydrolase